ncbi:hypothetical protein IWX46DRAFT_222299 [Phyllosticta citricarpa]|uniref:Uncharacterized protein n=1 Tax=Phyllosticta citricarpa TaxID=55181 RepID=A0ABR1MPL8_9PEZI
MWQREKGKNKQGAVELADWTAAAIQSDDMRNHHKDGCVTAHPSPEVNWKCFDVSAWQRPGIRSPPPPLSEIPVALHRVCHGSAVFRSVVVPTSSLACETLRILLDGSPPDVAFFACTRAATRDALCSFHDVDVAKDARHSTLGAAKDAAKVVAALAQVSIVLLGGILLRPGGGSHEGRHRRRPTAATAAVGNGGTGGGRRRDVERA